MKHKLSKRILCLFITLIMAISVMPITAYGTDNSDDVSAELMADAAPTALYIKDTIGGDTKSVDVDGSGAGATSGEGWSWDAENLCLKLEGFNGEWIQSTGNLEIVLSGTNTVTVADAEYAKGIESSGTLTINKTTSDTDDKLVIINEHLTTKGTVYGIYTKAEITVSGGTLDVKLLADNALVDSASIYGIYSGGYDFIQTDGAIVNVELESDAYVYGVYGSMDISGSGPTTVEVESKAVTYRNFAAASSGGGHFCGSGNVVLSATVNTEYEGGTYFPAGFAILGSYQIEPQNEAKVTTKGIIATYYNSTASSTWVGSKTTVSPADYIRSEKSIDSYYRVITDVSGNLITDMVFTGTDEVQPLTYTSSTLNELPASKVGEYESVDLTYGLKGAGNENQVWTITDGELPKGLNFWNWGSISGEITEPCEAGSITVKVEVGSGEDKRTLEGIVINYGEVVEPDKFLTIGGEPYNVKTDAEDAEANWSYDGDTKTLTLSGYNGGGIKCESDLNIILDGTNTVTVADESQAKGIEVDGSLTIDKTTSDTDDKLVIINENLTTKDTVYGIDAGRDITISGGTLDIKLLSDSAGIYGIDSKLIQTDSAIVKVKIESDASVYGVRGDMDISGSGPTTIEVESKEATNNYNYAGASTGGYFHGSGNVVLSATINKENENGQFPDGMAITGSYQIEPQNGATVTTKGIIASYYSATASSSWVGSKTTVSPADYIRSEKSIVDSYYRVITDVSGNFITDMVFTGTDEAQPLTYTSSTLNELPASKVGEYESVELTYGLKGAGSENQKWTITNGAVPSGLIFWNWGSIYGTLTQPCEAGSITLKVEVGSGEDKRTLEGIVFNYGAVSSLKPVTSVTIDVDEIVLSEDDITELPTLTFTPSDASYTEVTWTFGDKNIAEKYDLTQIVGRSAGKTTATVTTKEGGFTDTVDIYVREETPKAQLNELSIYGLSSNANYTINGEERTSSNGGSIDIEDAWRGESISIVKLNAEPKCNSLPQVISVAGKTEVSTVAITGVTEPEDDVYTTEYGIDTTTEGVSVADICWVYKNGEEWEEYTESKFEGGKEYAIKVVVSPKSAYILADEPTAIVNGKNATLVEKDGDNRIIYYSFGVLKEKYNVNVTSGENGSAWATPAIAVSGTEITLTASANTGYHFKEWEIVSGEVEIVDNKFTMPESDVEINAVFEENPPETYTVTVDSYGNGSALATPNVATEGTEIVLSTVPDSGYHFKEWEILSGEVEIVDNKFNMPAENVSIRAVFEENTYTITVGTDGNGTAEADYDEVKAGKQITLSAEANEGYHFKEWQIVSGDFIIVDNKFVMPSENVEIKAIFEKNVYTITVGNDGNGTASANVAEAVSGTEITLSAEPNEDYLFKKWEVVSGDITIEDNKFTMPISNVEIKAVFEPKVYNITVEVEGSGSATAAPTVASKGTEVTLATTINNGYHFKEWQVISGDVTIENNKFTMPASDVVIKAVFEKDAPKPTYVISFDSNGGGGSMESVEQYAGNYKLPRCDFYAPENMKFKAWSVDGTEYAVGDVIIVNSNVTVTVVWVEKEVEVYTITFEPNGAMGTMSNILANGGEFTLPECTYTAPEGKEFKAWKIDGTEYAVGDKVTVNANTTVTAIWKAIPIIKYNVTFDANGGSGEMAIVNTVASYTLPECTFTAPEGKEFMCWSVDGVNKNVGDTIVLNADITIKAVWKDTEISIIPETKINSYEKATGKASVVCDTDGEFVLIVIKYSGGAFKSANIIPTMFTMGDNEVEVDTDLNSGDKILLWSNMNSICPLCKAFIVE